MSAGFSFFIPLLIIGLLAYFGYQLIWKKEREDALSIDRIYAAFMAACARKDIQEIERIGEELIWNSKIRLHHVQYIESIINQFEKEGKHFDNLSNLVMNKRLSWEKIRGY